MLEPRAVPLASRLALALALAASPLACDGQPEERCDAICDCTECTEVERDTCLADTIADRDTAAAYDCGDAYDAYVDCELTKSRCRDDRFFLDGIDCAGELAELHDCEARASSLP
jgi:hypothetical protein